MLKPEAGDLVLDAGCGVGGASFWLAKHTRADFVGTTLSAVQLKSAEQYARKRGLEHRVKFYRMDYFAMEFPDETFDSVFGLESFCYSYPHPESVLKD